LILTYDLCVMLQGLDNTSIDDINVHESLDVRLNC